MANLLQKMNEEKNQKEIMEEMKLLVRAADWSHIEEVVQKICTSYPSGYRLFWSVCDSSRILEVYELESKHHRSVPLHINKIQ